MATAGRDVQQNVLFLTYEVLRVLNNTGVSVVSSIMPENDFWHSDYLNKAKNDFYLCSMIVRLDSGLNSRFVHGINKPQSQRSMQNFKEHIWQLFCQISSKSTKRFKMWQHLTFVQRTHKNSTFQTSYIFSKFLILCSCNLHTKARNLFCRRG
jgi:hypothetical protein